MTRESARGASVGIGLPGDAVTKSLGTILAGEGPQGEAREGPGNSAARTRARPLIHGGSVPPSLAPQVPGNPMPAEALVTCNACGSGDIQVFYRVKNVPAHSCLMLSSREEALAFPRGDIELGFCQGCGFIGNVRFDPGLNRYSAAYEETQAYSPRFLKFLDEVWQEQIARFGLAPGMTALDIGS